MIVPRGFTLNLGQCQTPGWRCWWTRSQQWGKPGHPPLSSTSDFWILPCQPLRSDFMWEIVILGSINKHGFWVPLITIEVFLKIYCHLNSQNFCRFSEDFFWMPNLFGGASPCFTKRGWWLGRGPKQKNTKISLAVWFFLVLMHKNYLEIDLKMR